MSKSFWAVVAIIVVVFGGIIFFSKSDSNSPSKTNAKPTENIIGSDKTGVKLVEYGDFQCPFCGQYYPIVEQVKAQYEDKIQFQFRNLPLYQAHQYALISAKAAEAAARQGKFWDMYNLLFQNQNTWVASSNPQPIFDQYAQQIGLDAVKFKNDMKSASVNDTIYADIDEFNKTKEKVSTPTFFLDGKKISPKSVEEFSQLIDAEIQAKAKATN